MNDLRKKLRAADPVIAEPALSTAEVHAMRRQALLELRAPTRRNRPTQLVWAVALILVCSVVARVLIGTRPSSSESPIAVPIGAEQRQLQLETPGGTRLIWVLNPDFQLREKHQ